MMSSRPIKAAIVLFYIGLVGYTIFRHEAFAPEAQSWLIARDASIFEILGQRMRYEGNPGLWHMLLVFPAKLGLPFYTQSILSGAIGTLIMALVTFYSPFPLWLVASLPLMTFMSFSYAVIARPYGLLGLFLLLIANIYHDRYRRFPTFFALLFFLTLTSVHGALLAITLLLFFFVGIYQGDAPLDSRSRRKIAWCIAAYTLLLSLITLELWPASDYALSQPAYEHFNFSLANFYGTGRWALDSTLTARTYWSVLPLAGLLYFFYLGRTLSLSLTLIGVMLALFAVKGVRTWHLGIIQFIFLFGAWTASKQARKASRTKLALVAGALLPCIFYNLNWGVSALRYDWANRYSGGQELAQYIKANNLQNRKIYGYGSIAIGVQPYFPKNIFANKNARSYNSWQKNRPYSSQLPDSLPADADVILISDIYREGFPDPYNLYPQLKKEGWLLQRTQIVPFYWRGTNNPLMTDFLLTKQPITDPSGRPLVSAVVEVPPRLQTAIKSGKGTLVTQLVDANKRHQVPYFKSMPVRHPDFPFKVQISRHEVESYLGAHNAEEMLKSATVSFRVFYCDTEPKPCRFTDSFAYIRHKLSWNLGSSSDLGTVFFQGYNTEQKPCTIAKRPLLSGTVRLDREVKRVFPAHRFLLAAVASISDGSWSNISYKLVHSQIIDLHKTNSFSVPSEKVNLPLGNTGRFLLYLLDLHACTTGDYDQCAERLINNRDDDMSHVIPLTTESLVTPYCGQSDLKMVGFYEPDWATIPVPSWLLR